MKRPTAASLSLAALLLAASALGTGCRSCQSPHDYSSPVADCECNSCGGRAGSVLSGVGQTAYQEGEEYYDDISVDEGPVMMEAIAE